MQIKRTLPLFMCAALVSLAGCTAANQTAGQALDDATLQSSVKADLASELNFDVFSINLETQNGIVQMAGFVDDAATAAQAQQIAAAVPGVVKVDNQLQVKAGDRSMGQSVDDGVITPKVKTGLGSIASTVNVDTYNGTVLLSGFVDSAEKKATAEKVARETANVKQVVNCIYVIQ